jgi:murein DD-endopeptidase MepM/ murein hydrolase activator NlpD
MGKAIKNGKKSLKIPAGLQSKLAIIKKQILQVIKNGRPYLAPKYWIIYAAAFGLGFYLWGPANGLAKLKEWRPFQRDQANRIATIQTLQQEIEQLKKEIKLQKIQEREKVIDFTPDSFSRPAFGEIIHGFDWINVKNTWKLHAGIDIETTPGSNIMASAEGVVQEISGSPEEGLTVILEHGSGWESVYGNLQEVTVKKGDQVIKGTIIGTSGTDSCNLKKPGFHFGITHNRQPVDPKKIIKGL